ncbi:MAG: peptidoglycan DD-metalloendopeptidase family protein [Betaproteobacteria bacterium]|nr:peptidoglycan DD-metalloendopeptidase family protein [Betaproteobacteria bacterium]
MTPYAPLRRAALVAALVFSGMVLAVAAMAPSPEAEATLLRRSVVEPVALGVTASVLPAPALYVREERFQRGDTLAGLLSRLGVTAEDTRRLIRMPALRMLRPGHVVTAEVDADGDALRLSYLAARDTQMVVERAADGFNARQLAAPLHTQTVLREGVIQSSLFAATDAAGVPDSVAIQIADIFAGDVDFHRDLRRGDRFAVVYEQHFLAGRAVHSGRVLAAEFVSQGRALRAVHYERARGGSGYYAPDGSNLRKAFLRSPLEYTRISSGFGMRRHPFQRSWRAHTGVDYAAPTGTRIRAAGDGRVEFAGFKGGYGNAVILRHRGQYSTLYGHLSRVAPGMRRGTRVAQGDIVGYVGSTGWATGPHLHYEFQVAGRARNPYAIAMPAGEPVPAAELPAFRRRAEPLVARLELLAAPPLARLE